MGTRRLWIALLLAVLQYAVLAQGTPNPCELCPDMPLASCDSAAGCKLGHDVIKGTVAGTPPCKKLTCNPGQFFRTNLGSNLAAVEITCNNEMKWVANGLTVVDEAVCVKKFLCTKATSPPASDCSGLDDWGCQKVDFANNDDKVCGGKQIMFYKTAAGSTWELTAEIVCDDVRGVWSGGDNMDVQSGDQVICADSNPDEPPHVSCIATNPLISGCDSTVNYTSSCEVIWTFTDDTPISCPSKTLFFKQGDGDWKSTDKVQCDRVTGEWKEGANLQNQLNAGDKVICAARDPNYDPCYRCPEISHGVCMFTEGCLGGSPPNVETVFSGNLQCKKMTCDKRQYFKTNLAESEVVDEITCNNEKKWIAKLKDGREQEITEAQCITRYSCRRKNPLKSVCDSHLSAYGCETIDFSNNENKHCDGKDIFIKSGADTSWKFVDYYLSCDEATGLWEGALRTAEWPYLRSGDEVICADSNPSEPPPVSCKSTNPLTSICDSSVVSTASCETIFYVRTRIFCDSNKTLYFKQGDGDWKSTDKVECDRVTGMWNEGSAMQNQLIAGDKVICAALDPNPDPCELCPDMPLASCDSAAGCVLGRDVIKGTVAGTPSCKKLTCSRREFFTTNVASSEVIEKITCNSEKKWIAKLEDGNREQEITEAVCIKRFLCLKKSPLISNCAGLEGSGCEEIDLTYDDDKDCGGKTLFFKTASATTWTDDEALSCDEVTGGWKLSKEKVELQAGDHVICADTNPAPPLETSEKVRRYMEIGRFSKTQ